MTSTENETPAFREWAVLELFGHRRVAGVVTECQIAGEGFLRVDIPGEKPDEVIATQFIRPAAIYALMPTSEEVARAVARTNRPEPVRRWELPASTEPSHAATHDLDDDEDDDEEKPF